MELRRYLYLLRRRWLLIVVTVIVGATVGYLTTSRTAYYRTSAQIYVGSNNIQNDASQLYGVTGFNQIVATFATMIPNATFAQTAISSTGISRTVGAVVSETKASIVADTSLIDVTVTDTDPLYAEELANGIATAFTTQIKNYQPGTTVGPGSVPAEPAYVFQDAYLPIKPLGTQLKRRVILGLVFGLVISILLVLLFDYLDITVKNPEELERRLDLPVLGIVPFRRSLPERVSLG